MVGGESAKIGSVPARLGFLHTSPVHVATFDAHVAEVDPSVLTVHAVDETLLETARRYGANHESVVIAVAQALVDLARDGANVIVCTCSTIGGTAESTVASGVRVLRVDRPMAAAAVASAGRIAVVAAVESTLEPTVALLSDECVRQHRLPLIELRPCLDAWAFWEAGDVGGYYRSVADHVNSLDDSFDVVVLAQASMFGALRLLDERPGRHVLSSPSSAVRAAIECIR